LKPGDVIRDPKLVRPGMRVAIEWVIDGRREHTLSRRDEKTGYWLVAPPPPMGNEDISDGAFRLGCVTLLSLPSSPQEEVPVGSRWRMADGSCVIRVVRLEGHRAVYEYEKARSTRVMGREFDWTPELLKASCTRLPDTEAKPAEPARCEPSEHAFRYDGTTVHPCVVCGAEPPKPEPSPADPWEEHARQEARIYEEMKRHDTRNWRPPTKPTFGPPTPMLTGSAGLACPLYRSKR